MSLTDEQKNLLQEKVDGLENQNQNLTTANQQNEITAADLYLADLVFKEILDGFHSDIYFYEEELKRLNGTSVIKPLQEENFIINDTIEDSRIEIQNGKLKIEENGTEIINVPIIPIRGYSKSEKNIGKNFDIWSRDRHGSTTSTILSSSIFTIDKYHRKLRLKMDGKEQEIDIASLYSLPQILDGTNLAASLQTLFQTIPSGSILNEILAPQFELTVGDVLYIKVDGGTQQAATILASDFSQVFDSLVLASAQELVNLFNKSWTGVKASLEGPQIKLEHNGSDSFQIVDGKGNPNSKIGFPTNLIYNQSPFSTMTCLFREDLQVFVFSSGTGGSTSSAEVITAEPITQIETFTSLEGGDSQFQLSFFPILSGSYSIVKDNTILTEGTDYTLNKSTGFLQLTFLLETGENIVVSYQYISDLRTLIGFSDLSKQTKIQGRYANNRLKIEIDGKAEIIDIADFRKCFNSSTLGDNNDDLGVGWSGVGNQIGYIGNFRAGPLFCSGIDNGKQVAESIQAKLREVASGGFEYAICKYYSYTQQFQIWSGTIAKHDMTESISSVRILPLTEDPNRDARQYLGFLNPIEESFEKSLDTLGSLYDELNKTTSPYQNIFVSILNDRSNWENRITHSVLYTSDIGYKIGNSFQNYAFPTTKIYDNASKSLPRMYPNTKLTIDAKNYGFDYFYTTTLNNVEFNAAIPFGEYTETELADQITNLFSGAITCEYDTTTKKFTLSSSEDFALLWGTGRNRANSIGFDLGFNAIDTGFAKSHTSNFQIQYFNENPGELVYPKQFFALPPFVSDTTVDELSALSKEQYYLRSENQYSNLLNSLKSLTSYDNEVFLNSWEFLGNLELAFLIQEINALRFQKGAYANHISENDSIINQKTAALDAVIENFNNLFSFLQSHGNLIEFALETRTFSPFLNSLNISSATSGKRVYNNPTPIIKYENGNGRHINGSFDFPGLFKVGVTFTPEFRSFTLTCTKTLHGGLGITSVKLNITDTTFQTILTLVDTSTVVDLDIDLTSSPNNTISGLISTISSDSGYTVTYDAAKLIGKTSEKFKLQHNDTFNIQSNGTNVTSVTFLATNGLSVSGQNGITRIYSGINDRLKININNELKTVSNDIAINFATGLEISANLSNTYIQAGTISGQIHPLIGPTIPLVENVNFYVDYLAGKIFFNPISLPLLIGSKVSFDYQSANFREIILETQLRPDDIASKIQQEVRNIQISNIETRSAYLGFICYYDFTNRRYALISGSGGTGSNVRILSSSVNDAAEGLKLGYKNQGGSLISNGGAEQAGSGNIVNNNFVSLSEIQTIINNSLPAGFIVGGTNYLELTSTLNSSNSKILIKSDSTAASKLGFDININDYSNPNSEFQMVNSNSLENVSNIEIKSPSSHHLERNFEIDKGQIQAIISSIDLGNVQERIAKVSSRLLYSFTTRINQINVRSAQILSLLNENLYIQRRNAIPDRLNSSDGSYYQIGQLISASETNQATQAGNQNSINNLEDLING